MSDGFRSIWDPATVVEDEQSYEVITTSGDRRNVVAHVDGNGVVSFISRDGRGNLPDDLTHQVRSIRVATGGPLVAM